ncbi:uncharacterized protein LOC143348377 [Colletes latitarsis]|uniref:uncharacterized protein LOC143348377 n=1 Tax=Colletes latitarsis TaxID=2605962 RepID=UPI0040374749
MYGYLKLLDPVVICPYNKNHLIVRSRIQKHIMKCEKQYPEHYKVMCPYNATHRLFKNELEEHIITCPTRSVLESEFHSEPKNRGCTNFPLHSEVSSTVDFTENWDLDANDCSRFLTDNESVLDNNTKTHMKNLHTNLKDILENKEIRGPRGYSEAMLRESNEDSCVEDQESVISSMGIGRGKVIKDKNRLKVIGLGRGRPANIE